MNPFLVLKSSLSLAILPLLDKLGLLSLQQGTLLFSRMKKIASVSFPLLKPNAKKILFLSLKATWKPHLAWEYALALALRLRGAECIFLLDDNFFPKSDIHYHKNYLRVWSRVAYASSKLFRKYLKMPVYWLGDYISQEERNRLQKIAFNTPYEDLSEIEYNGIAIHETIKPSLVRFFRRASIPETAFGKKIHREFVLSGLLASFVLPKVLGEVKPATVVALNGKFFAENIMYQLCKRQAVPIYTYERGKIRDSLGIVFNQIAVDNDCSYAWEHFKNRTLQEEESKEIRSYIEERKKGARTVLHFHPNPEEDEKAIKQEINFNEGKKHFVLFTNIVWDTAVQGKDIAFQNMFEWVRETIEFFSRYPEANLVIRIHPAEVKITSDVTTEKVEDFLSVTFDSLPQNVTVIPPESDISSYKLVDLCDAVLVYSSTIGLESSLEKKIALTCANVHYAGKGFTVDITSQKEYHETLDKLIKGEFSTQLDWDIAWKYAYVFFLKCMIPFPLVSEKAVGKFDHLAFDHPDDFAIGKDSNLDFICKSILNETQVF